MSPSFPVEVKPCVVTDSANLTRPLKHRSPVPRRQPQLAASTLPRERKPTASRPHKEHLDIVELPPSLHLDVWLCYAMWLGGVFGSLYCMQQQIANWAMAETLIDSDTDSDSDGSAEHDMAESTHEAPCTDGGEELSDAEWTHVAPGAVNVEMGADDDTWDMVEFG